MGKYEKFIEKTNYRITTSTLCATHSTSFEIRFPAKALRQSSTRYEKSNFGAGVELSRRAETRCVASQRIVRQGVFADDKLWQSTRAQADGEVEGEG